MVNVKPSIIEEEKEIMKNVLKKIALLMLAVSMAVPAATAISMPEASVVEAASTKKITLYVGETYAISAKKLSSNKKAVAKPVKDDYGTYSIKAKKTGTATLTAKSSYGSTTKYKVTVKAHKCSAKLSWMGEKNLLITVKNGSAQTFERVKINYTIKNKSGEIYESDTVGISGLMAKGTGYYSIYLKSNYTDVDVDQCSAKITEVSHYPEYTYKDVTKKVKVTTTETKEEKAVVFDVKKQNTVNKYVYGNIYILLKNSSDELIGFDTVPASLNKKATDTTSRTVYLNLNPDYDHYEVVSSFYTTVRK